MVSMFFIIVKVVVHAYKEGRKLYFRGDLEIQEGTTLKQALINLGNVMKESIIDIVTDKSEYIVVVHNDTAIDFVENQNRILNNKDTLKLLPQVVGG
jgi:hypothetical protein